MPVYSCRRNEITKSRIEKQGTNWETFNTPNRGFWWGKKKLLVPRPTKGWSKFKSVVEFLEFSAITELLSFQEFIATNMHGRESVRLPKVNIWRCYHSVVHGFRTICLHRWNDLCATPTSFYLRTKWSFFLTLSIANTNQTFSHYMRGNHQIFNFSFDEIENQGIAICKSISKEGFFLIYQQLIPEV